MAQPSMANLAVLLSARSQASGPPLTPAEVGDFVRQYVAATNEASAAKLMALVLQDPAVSSVGLGKISRGFDAIRAATQAATASGARLEVSVESVDVALLAIDTALAVAQIKVNDGPGAATMIVKRTAEGLRLVHEHYSLRPGSSTPSPSAPAKKK